MFADWECKVHPIVGSGGQDGEEEEAVQAEAHQCMRYILGIVLQTALALGGVVDDSSVPSKLLHDASHADIWAYKTDDPSNCD